MSGKQQLPTHFIYALTEPQSDIVRYVGRTNDVPRRYREHIQGAHSNSPKDAWIRALLDRQQVPGLLTLETVQGQGVAMEREEYWIEHYENKDKIFNWNGIKTPRDGGTRIDDPDIAAHTLDQIRREVGQ